MEGFFIAVAFLAVITFLVKLEDFGIIRGKIKTV